MKTPRIIIALGLGLAACATTPGDIDRTQAGKVDKAVLDGEWYFRPAVVGADYQQGTLFEGLEGSLERVRWSIQEHELVAYRSYPLLDGAEQGTGEAQYQGNPVAIFAVTSHFDVKREYNPATGEQSNVIVENTTDRPWFERSSMRVDWSQNLLPDPYTLSGFISATSGAPYYVQEHELDNPDRAEVTADAINIVVRYVLSPDTQACADLLVDPAYCVAASARLKLSFRKVAAGDYVPLPYPDSAYVYDAAHRPVFTGSWGALGASRCDATTPGADWSRCARTGVPMFARFGFFRSERRAFDSEWQWTRDGRVTLINRWNLWVRSKDSRGNLIAPPYRDARRLVYHTNARFPGDDDLASAAATLTGDWDGAFRNAVAEVRRAVDRHVKASDLPPVFVVEPNGCSIAAATAFAAARGLVDALRAHGIMEVTAGNLERACAVLEAKGGFVWQKQGDLRHSLLVWVGAPQLSGPLGYGPSAADPVTGEIVSANAYVYGAAIDAYASEAADVVAVMNGQLALDDVAAGSIVRAQLSRRPGASYGPLSEDRLAAMRAVHRSQAARGSLARGPDALAASAARLSRLAGTRVEREALSSDELRRAVLGPSRWQPGTPSASFSPVLVLGDETLRRYDARVNALGQAAICMADLTDDGLLSLAQELAGKSWEEVYAVARKRTFRAIATHELGHTFGLRHNFQGSFDALNYVPAFWDSYHHDAATGRAEVSRVDPLSGAPTGAERLMYSSIMDYSARAFADDAEGLGPYDVAAIAFGYGELVQVFATPRAYAFESLAFLGDYTSLPKLLDPRLGCAISTAGGACPALKLPVFAGGITDAAFTTYLHTALDGATPRPDLLTRRAYVPFADVYQSWTNYYATDFDRLATDPAYTPPPWTLPDEVPFMFCPDEYAWSGNTSCQRWDKGASYAEVVADRMERYDQYYFFTSFKRDRVRFKTGLDYLARTLDRYLMPMSDMWRNYLYATAIGIGVDESGRSLTLADFPIGQDWQRAAVLGLDYLGQIALQPEPGDYCLGADAQGRALYRPWAKVWPSLAGATADSFVSSCPPGSGLTVPPGVGRFFDSTWTDEYYYEQTRVGAFWDKLAAVLALTSNQGYFYRDFGQALDPGTFELSYWRGQREAMLDLFGGLLAGDGGKFAWRYDATRPEGERIVPAPVSDQFQTPFDYTGLPRIESSSSWSLRYWALVFALARFDSAYAPSPDFAVYGRVCLEGYLDCLGIDASVGVERYTDPLTGYTYMASRTDVATVPDAEGQLHPERAIGAALLREATSYVEGDPAHGVPSFTVLDAALTAARAARDGGAPCALTDDERGRYFGSAAGTQTSAELSASQLADLVTSRLAAYNDRRDGITRRSSFFDVVRQLAYVLQYGG